MLFRISQCLCLMVMLGGMHLVFAETADSVYTNGRIYTVNDKQPWAEAVAIKGKHFLFVGNNAAVRQYIGKNTEVVDLKGQMVMPGIHDGHEHLILAGARAAFWCPMPKGPFGEASAQAISACAKTIKREWLEVGLYFAEQFPDGKPDRKYLDKLFPDRPVVFTESTFHIALVNTKAMELAGITAELSMAPYPSGSKTSQAR